LYNTVHEAHYNKPVDAEKTLAMVSGVILFPQLDSAAWSCQQYAIVIPWARIRAHKTTIR
jgi:hypothetical protein